MVNTFALAFLLVFASFDPGPLHVKCAFVTNGYRGKQQFLAAMTISNTGNKPMPATGWSIYFCLRYHGTLEAQDSGFTIRFVEGDLFRIRPTAAFKGLKPGGSTVLSFTGSGEIANYEDLPSGLFWVADRDTTRAITLHNVTYDPGSLSGRPASEPLVDCPEDSIPPLIPRPVSFKRGQGYFLLDGNAGLSFDPEFKKEAGYLSETLERLMGQPNHATGGKKRLILRRSALAAEAYDLAITPDSVVISASTGAGMLYGIQTIKNLLPAAVWTGRHSRLTLPCIRISDAPRFPVRAFMLDVARNFQTKSEVLKLLDLMALYKLNTFHFHLTDDEGWRLEIPGLPELTKVGAVRGYPFSNGERLHPSYGSGPDPRNPAGSGYYSKKDFIDILRYADTLHIRVIPEIDMPAHSTAAVRSMLARYRQYVRSGDREAATRYLLSDTGSRVFNVMDPSLPSVDHFIQKVVDEIFSMYKEAGLECRVIHMGGDEVPASAGWNSGLFHRRFARVERLLQERGVTLNTWEELAIGTGGGDSPRKVWTFPDFIRDGVRLDAWYNIAGNEAVPYQLANAGYKTTLTCLDYLYFDLANERSFYEPGDEWLGFLDTRKILSFLPFDYYRNTTSDLTGKVLPAGYFAQKEKLTEQGRQNIIGIQGALWGENITSAGIMEYMIVPRLLALAEKAWTSAPDWEIEADTLRSKQLYERYWNQFAARLYKFELPKLRGYLVQFHLRKIL
jgi:hexosaminidase